MADEEQDQLLSNIIPDQTATASEEVSDTTEQDTSANTSVPVHSSGSVSPVMSRDTLLSPTSASHPLPPRPTSVDPSATISAPQAAIPVSVPRTRGGFEIDDDEEDEDNEETKDEVDVYDPSAGFDVDVDVTTPAPEQTAIDSNTQSPAQENGITPLPVQTSGDLGASSSALPAAEPSYNPVEAATPSVADTQIQATLSRSQVNGFSAALPKTRLAHDVVGILEDRIKDDPRGDTEAYLELISELKSRNKQDEVRTIYDQYLKTFPLDVSDPRLSSTDVHTDLR